MNRYRHCEKGNPDEAIQSSFGFTLIELLIAMVIFSLISIGSLASLNQMMRAREQQVMHHEMNQTLDLAYAHIFQDMMWLVGDVSAVSEDLEVTRTQTSHKDSVSQVHYQLKEGKLFRVVGNEQEASTVRLLANVEDLHLSWLLSNKQWVGVFDQSSLSETPLLLRLQFKTAYLGEVTWVFATPHL